MATDAPWLNDPIIGDSPPRPAPIGARAIPGTGPKPPAPRDPLLVRKDELAIRKAENDLAKPDAPNLPQGMRMGPNGVAEYIPGVPPPKGAQGSVEQGKSASFLKRAINAEGNFQGLGKVEPRGLIGQSVKDNFPNVANSLSGSTRQLADQAEREFIAAILRYDSGAAIPPEEFVTNGLIYFPRPGDSDEVLKQKAQSRRAAIEGLYAASGPAAAGMDMSFGPDAAGGQENQAGNTPGARAPTAKDIYGGGVELGMDRWGRDDPFNRDQYLADRYGLKQGDEDQILGFWKANVGNPGLTPDAAKRWYVENNLPPPSDEDLARAVQQAQTASGFQGLDTTAAESQYKGNLDAILKERGINPEGMADTIHGKVSQGVMIGAGDEFGGLGGALAATLTGNNPIAGYQVERDVLRRQLERSGEANPTTSLVSEVGGGLVTGGMGFGSAARLAKAASTARKLPNVARAASLQRQATKAAAGAGAKVGGAAGFNYGEGPVGSPVNALLGAVGGTVIGAGMQTAAPSLGKVWSKFTDKVGTKVADQGQRAVIEAGERRQVPIRAADVLPDMAHRRAVVKTSEAGNIIKRADDADIQATEQAMARDVGGGGQNLSRETFGETARAALMRHGDKTRERARKLYEQADGEVQGKRFTAPTGASQIDTEIATLREAGENTNGPMIRFLEGLKKDLGGPQGGGVTITGLRDQRSAVRSNLKNAGLDATAGEAVVLRVLDAVGQDIDGALRGTPAQSIYREADAVWRERAKFRKEITERLLGPRTRPKSGEQVADAVRSMARDDLGRMRRTWEVLDPDERTDLAASFAQSLGRDNKGNFSFTRLLSQTVGDEIGQKPSLPPGAVTLIFGKEGAAALRDLQTIAKAKVSAASETNHSRTGNVVQNAKGGLRAVLLAGFGLAQGGVVGGIVLPAAGHLVARMGDERAARLVTNPDFVKWLKTVPQAQGKAGIDRQLARLNSIASKVPGMNADVEALKRALSGYANENGPSRLAAEPGSADDDRKAK